MDPVTGAALINAGSSLLGGVLGGKGKKGPDFEDIKNENRTVLMNQIQWKVQDAIKAGIHPLAALGVSSASGPSGGWAVGDSSSGPDWGTIAGDLGQNVSRAITAHGSQEDRMMQQALQKQTLEKGDLENELLRSNIALNRAQLPPAFGGPARVIDGQGGIQIIPKEIVSRNGQSEKGISASNQYIQWNDDGDLVRVPSSAWADAGLDDGPAAWYQQLTQTVPDIARANVKSIGRKIARGAKKSWSERSRWKTKDYWTFND